MENLNPTEDNINMLKNLDKRSTFSEYNKNIKYFGNGKTGHLVNNELNKRRIQPAIHAIERTFLHPNVKTKKIKVN